MKTRKNKNNNIKTEKNIYSNQVDSQQINNEQFDNNERVSYLTKLSEKTLSSLKKTRDFAIDKGARMLGFQRIQNIDDYNDSNEKLDNSSLPPYLKELGNTIEKGIDNANVLLDVTEPSINRIVDKVSTIGANAASKINESAISVALNTAEAIPGVGVGIGLVRDIDKVLTAGEAVIEAGADTVTTFADEISNVSKVLKEKINDVKNITSETIENVERFNNTDNIKSSFSKYMKGGRKSKKFKKTYRKFTRKLKYKR